MRPSKIISGGQTGADQAGLHAAKILKIKTGGTAPYNYMTDEGPNLGLLRSYGLNPGPYDPKTYPKRTRINIADSDGTVIFKALGIRSPGSQLTINICIAMNKPHIINPTPSRLRKWVEDQGILTLNVAGNRERINPGLEERVTKILVEAFT